MPPKKAPPASKAAQKRNARWDDPNPRSKATKTTDAGNKSKQKTTPTQQDSQSSITTTTGMSSIPSGTTARSSTQDRTHARDSNDPIPSTSGQGSSDPTTSDSVIWSNSSGCMFKKTPSGVYFLDESIPAWVELGQMTAQQIADNTGDRVPPVQQATSPVESQDQPQVVAEVPAQTGNSWTNLQVRDAQNVLATRAGSSPLKTREALQDNARDLASIQELMSTVKTRLTTLGVEPRPAAPQPGPSGVTNPGSETSPTTGETPLSNMLKNLPKALYAHVPQTLRERIWKHMFVDFRQLLLDPLLPIQGRTLVLQKNQETGVPEWVETNTSKEIPNFNIWAKAFRTYAAIYVAKYPEKAVDMLKYEHMIHDASLRFQWTAVLTYDVYFREYISADPTVSWGITNSELYTDCFTGKALPTYKPNLFGKPKQGSAPKPCFQYKSKCTWKNCKFQHRCSKCGKHGHPAFQCRTQEVNAYQSGTSGSMDTN